MKIEKLTLSSFSSHVATTIDFAQPLLLLVGHLNSGKSSCVQGIEYALTAELERYRKKNAAFTDLIHDRNRTPDSRFIVELRTAEGTMKRGKAMTGPAFCAWDGKTENAEIEAYRAWHTSKDILSALLATGDFFDKEAKDQKELILRLVGAKVTTPSVHAAYAHDKAAFSLLAIKDFDSIQSLDNAYGEAYKLRTAVNRDLKVLQPAPQPEGTEPDVDGIKKQIRTVEGQRTAKVQELGAARAALGRPSLKPTLERQLKEIEDWLDKHQTSQEDVEAMNKELAAAKEKQAKAQAESDESKELLLKARAEYLVHEKNHDVLMKFNGRCVVGQHECPASREQMGKAKTEEYELAKLAKDAGMKLAEAVNVLEVKARDRSAIASVEGRMATAKLDIAEWDRKEKQAEELEKQIAELGEEVAGDPEAVKKLELAIAELDGRLAKGRGILETRQTWVMRKQAVQEVAAKRKALEQQSTQLEQLVEFFGPKGVKVRLIEEKTAAFSEMVNKGAAAFGFGFSFSAEPWTMAAKWPDSSVWKPVDRLSTSERYRLGVALQVAIAKTTGVNLVVVDGSELLPPKEFGQLLKLLLSTGVQAIVVKTLTGKTEEEFKKAPPKIPGCQVLWVSNTGGVSKMEVLV